MTAGEEPEAVAALRTSLEAYLQADFPGFEVDRDRDYVIRRGRTRVLIRPTEHQGQTFVRIYSMTNVGVTIDGALTRFLATENAGLAFGKFHLGEEGSAPYVALGHTLLGDFLNRAELEVAVTAVAEADDRYADTIKSRFGGRRFTDIPEVSEFLATAEAAAERDAVEAGGRPPGRQSLAFRTRWALLAFAAAIGGGVLSYAIESSIWLSLFAGVVVLQLVGRGIPDLITDPDKPRRALYFLLGPALATGILALTYGLWGRWWLSVLLGTVGALPLNAILAPRLFPRIHGEETLDSIRRLTEQHRIASGG
jgi:hypothetical protein